MKDLLKTISSRQPDEQIRSDGSDHDPLELFLASASLSDVVRLLHANGTHDPHCLGSLTAKLIELGDQTTDGRDDDGQVYADAMRLQRHRLAHDPGSRRDLALHPRTYGRPPKQLVTDADGWVVPMVEAEVECMSADDLAILRYQVIMRVGRQHDIHPDFRPLLLKLATHDQTLDSLAIFRQDRMGSKEGRHSYLLAAVAGPFIDVVMSDPDEGIELEAAAWDFAKRRLSIASSASRRQFLQCLFEISSLVALIDTSRLLAARHSQAQAHAGQATRSAIAEFILSNLILLATRSREALTKDQVEIGSFVRRDFVGRSSVDLPKAMFERWSAGRSSIRLMLDLALLTLLADYKQHDLKPMPIMLERDAMARSIEHLADIERSPLGLAAARAIDGGWHSGDSAGAA